MAKSVAVIAAEETVKHDAERVLTTGVRVRVNRVSQMLLDAAVHKVKEPEVPLWYDEDRDREVLNPNHPHYLAAMEEYEREQRLAAIDAAILWGVDLVDGLPKDKLWIKKLKYFAEKLGHIDLSEYDLEDEFELEFLYKRFIALSAEDLSNLMPEIMGGVTEEDVAKAVETFQGDETPDAD